MPEKRRLPLWLFFLLVATACGSEPSDTARVEPMGAETVQNTSSPALVDVPAIAGIRFVPDAPVAGRSAQATVKLAAVAGVDEPTPNLQLDFVWTLDGLAMPAVGRSVDLSRAPVGGRLEVTVTPRIAESTGVPRSHAVRLVAAPPRVLGVSFVPAQGLTAAASVEARPIVEGGDPRRTSHRFEWIVNGRRRGTHEPRFSTDGLRRGDEIQVEVTAYTAGASSEPYVSEPIVLVNAPPVLVPRPLTLNDAGGVDMRLEAVDPDGDAPLLFELIEGPAGLAVSRSGQLTWPSAHEKPGHHSVELAISDALGAQRPSRRPRARSRNRRD